MNPNSAETTSTTALNAPVERPKAPRKAHVGAHAPDVAPRKAKASHKAKSVKKANTGATLAKSRKKAGGTGTETKTAKVLDLLKRPGGASLKELMKATGWQSHSVRGFLSGAIAKKAGLAVTSSKAEDGERRYSVKS